MTHNPELPRPRRRVSRGTCALLTALAGALLVSSIPSFAQEPAAAPAPAATTGVGALTGVVVDETAGKLLEGAEITIDGTNIGTVTERGGMFTLRNVPAGTHQITATYPGLEPETLNITVVADTTTEVQTFRLASGVVALGEITISSSREGMAQAVALQKISIQAKLIAAADQFGPISEGNVGEYLKYLPGLSIDYNANDARGVSLRGLNTSFTVVAVDGTPMAASSSTADTRRFEFEQIAMNNVETTELFKTMTPDIPANSTGGFVNFVTKSAFDRNDVSSFSYDLNFVAPSTNFSFSKESGVWGTGKEYVIRPNLDLNYSRRVSDKIGVNFNYRFSERYDDSPRVERSWVNAATLWSAPQLGQINVRTEQKITHREAFATKVDFRLSDNTKLLVAGQWNWYDLLFHQRGPQFVMGSGSTVAGDASNPVYSTVGTQGTGGTNFNVRNDVLYRNKYGTTLHFNTTLEQKFGDRSKLLLTGYWSQADGQYRDIQKGFTSSQVQLNTGLITGMSITDVYGADAPTVSLRNGTAPVDLDVVRLLANYNLPAAGATGSANFQTRPWTTLDTKTGVNGSYQIDFPELGMPLKVQAGFALDNTQRDIDRITRRGAVPLTTGSALDALRDEGFTKDLAYGWGTYQVVDPYKIVDAYGVNLGYTSEWLYRKFEEKNTALYLRADLDVTKDLLLIGGVRWEDRTIDGEAQNKANSRSVLAITKLDYAELYPSLTFKYNPSKAKQVYVRGGVSRTVGHPDYADMIPTAEVESAVGQGNGRLIAIDEGIQPYFTLNTDISIDYYLKNQGVVGLALFRKDVSNFLISRSMTAEEIQYYSELNELDPANFTGPNGVTQIVYNGPDSSVQGIELSYAQSLSFLPKPFDGLNVQANYTMSDADGDSNDVIWAQKRGAASKTWNLIIGYRIGKWSFTSSTNWTDDTVASGAVNSEWRTGTANANPALDTQLVSVKAASTRTDLKVEYGFSEKYKAYIGIQNIFGEGRDDFWQGYLPENQNVRLRRNNFNFGEPYINFGVRGRF
jgi:TonB-dependent receptor